METTMIELDDAILESRVNAASLAFRAAAAAKEARRRARLEKRIRAVFAATGRTWIPLLLFSQNSVSKQTVLEAAAMGILKQRAAAHDFYRLVNP